MTERKYRNYQEYYANYLGGWSFADGDQVLTITDVQEQAVRNKDNTVEDRLTVSFKETDLPLILNRTNADMIYKVTGAAFTGDWIGKKIKVGTSKVRAFGDVFDAVRVRDEKIPVGPVEKATQPQIRALFDLINTGKIKLEAMLKFYDVTDIEQLTKDQARDIIRSKTGEVIE